MSALTKGQNGPLPTPDVIVTVDLATAADLSALLVTDRGVVRTDDDFVFYNQPTGPGVRLEQAAATLGAPPWRVFLGITLPLAWPGIVAGAILAFLQKEGPATEVSQLMAALPGSEAALAEAGLDLEPEATGSDETDPSGSDEPA